MAKMMTYKEANTVLESSLTPNARCICKKTAIDNHAVASRLSAFVNNRLVPASMVVLITYSIQFKDWDGTVLSTQTVKYGHKPTKPANPTRTGYTFTGWSNNPDSAPTGDTVYTAQYQINSYTIRFLDYDGSVLKTQSVNHGSTPTPPSDPSRAGYSFTGWYPSITAATQNRDYTAQYTISSFTVTFLDGNGGVFNTQTVSYGGYASAPSSNPTKTGYTFKGWSPNPSSTPITSNTTFSPTWDYVNYTVTFKVRMPEATEYTILSSKSDYHIGDSISIPTVQEIQGYTFSGWDVYIPPTVTEENAFFRLNHALTALGWYEPTGNDPSLPSFYITFYYNGGIDDDGSTGPMVKGKGYGSSFSHSEGPHLTWNGQGRKRFMRWESIPASDTPAEGVPVYKDYELYALWDDVEDDETFYVQYILWKTIREDDPSYGPGNTTTRTEYDYITGLHFGDPIPRPRPGDPSEEGYRFMGWSVDFENDTVDNNMTINGSLIPDDFYGPLTYNVSFWVAQEYAPSAGRDVEVERWPYEMGETVTCPSNPYTSETDATFEGWSVNGQLLQPGDTFLCTGEDAYWASYSSGGTPTPPTPTQSIDITFDVNNDLFSPVTITRNLTNGSYTLLASDFPSWPTTTTGPGPNLSLDINYDENEHIAGASGLNFSLSLYATDDYSWSGSMSLSPGDSGSFSRRSSEAEYTADDDMWNYSAGDVLTHDTTITASYSRTGDGVPADGDEVSIDYSCNGHSGTISSAWGSYESFDPSDFLNS